MRSLTLVRHAKATHDEPQWTDFDRPLTDRGLRDAPLMAQRFVRAGVLPDRLIASPAKRSLATATFFAEALGLAPDAIRQEAAIYEADVRQLFDLVQSLDDADEHVALFGHNPGFSDLCCLLGGADINEMSPAAVARFEFDVSRWRDIAPGSGRLMAYSFPKERE